MKIAIYYFLTAALNFLCIIFFGNKINISSLSIIPLFLMALSVFQAIYFNNNRGKNDFNSNNYSDLSDSQWEILSLYISRSYMIATPFFIPFILFFPSWVKATSVFIFIIAFAGGAIFFKIKHRDELNAKEQSELRELEEQTKKESMGKYR